MKTAVMKTLRQFLITGAFIVLASAAAFAQKDDDQKKPKPKPSPPIVVVPDGGKKPKGNERPPQKPQGEQAETAMTPGRFD